MVRFVLGFAAAFGLCVAGAQAAGQNQNQKSTNQKAATGQQSQYQKADQTHKGEKEAKITSVDAKKGTVTVQMTDANGKQTEKTFHLTGEVRYFDSTGRVAAADIFRTGDSVLVLEEEGHLKQLRKKDTTADHGKTGTSSGTKKPGGR